MPATFPVFSGQKLFCCHHLIRKDTFSPAWFSESKLPLTDIVVSWKKMIEAKTLRNGILRKLEMWFSETSVCLGSLAFSKPTSTFGLKLLNHLKPGGNEPCSHTEADLTAGLLGKLWLWRGQQIWSWGGPTNYITFQNLFFFKCSNLSGKNCEVFFVLVALSELEEKFLFICRTTLTQIVIKFYWK